MSLDFPTPNIGDQFGDTTIIDNSLYRYNHRQPFMVRGKCSCDREYYVSLASLYKDQPHLCRTCYNKFFDRKDRLLMHIWNAMKQRCYNSNDKKYAQYGNRGIVVCDEWLESSVPFIKWALANGYKAGLTIDRKDNDLGYSPNNCRWITHKQNMWNTRGSQKSKSKFKGIAFITRKNKWRAEIIHNEHRHYIGYFVSEIDAALAYNEKAKELFGEYAHLNKIEEQPGFTL